MIQLGETVRIRDDGPAAQVGLTGVVLDRGSATDPYAPGHWLLVDLQPDATGLHGGEYWFEPKHVERIENAATSGADKS